MFDRSSISIWRNVTESVTIGDMERERVASVRAPDLAVWALARGRRWLTSAEVADLIGVPVDQVRRRLAAPRRRGEWITPARGLWVPVPAEYRTWGAPPAMEFIDPLMKHLGIDYYVGWLNAAAVYGASHQAVQVFQVATSTSVKERTLGRNVLRFFERRHVGSVPTRQHVTPAGYATISTPAVTALDVANDIVVAGGMSNAATVIAELAEHNDFDLADVARLSDRYPASASRRVGWILQNYTGRLDLGPLIEATAKAVPTPSRLNPTREASGPVDDRWMIYLNDDEIEVES